MGLNCFTVLFTLWTAQLLIYVVKGRTFYLVFYCLSLNLFRQLVFSIPPENIKNLLFFMFSGGTKRDQWHEIG